MDYFNEKFENEKDKNNNIIMNLKNKIRMLENKTNRLQSMNEVFLDLLKKQDRSINNLRNDSNNFYLDNDYPRTYNLINNFKHRYNELESSYPINEEYSRPRLRKSNSQLDMFSMKSLRGDRRGKPQDRCRQVRYQHPQLHRDACHHPHL